MPTKPRSQHPLDKQQRDGYRDAEYADYKVSCEIGAHQPKMQRYRSTLITEMPVPEYPDQTISVHARYIKHTSLARSNYDTVTKYFRTLAGVDEVFTPLRPNEALATKFTWRHTGTLLARVSLEEILEN